MDSFGPRLIYTFRSTVFVVVCSAGAFIPADKLQADDVMKSIGYLSRGRRCVFMWFLPPRWI